MENPFAATLLNDFVFCPASIYFHMVDADADKMTYESHEQLQGSSLHEKTDRQEYSDKSSILQGVSVYCEQFGIEGKIDIFDTESGVLTERKRKITAVYDGQVFQLYAYCYALREAGYRVNELRIYSSLDNKVYPIPLPEEDDLMNHKFVETVTRFRQFSLDSFTQTNQAKCEKCVYEPLCPYTAKEST